MLHIMHKHDIALHVHPTTHMAQASSIIEAAATTDTLNTKHIAIGGSSEPD